jgi:hypothetical protein
MLSRCAAVPGGACGPEVMLRGARLRSSVWRYGEADACDTVWSRGGPSSQAAREDGAWTGEREATDGDSGELG